MSGASSTGAPTLLVWRSSLPVQLHGVGATTYVLSACIRPLPYIGSYPFNYMEFARRVLGEAPTLLRLPPAGALIHVRHLPPSPTTSLCASISPPYVHASLDQVPLDEPSWALPPFYNGLLRPLSGSSVERALPAFTFTPIERALPASSSAAGVNVNASSLAAGVNVNEGTSSAGGGAPSRLFGGATVCCVRKPTKMNASAALALIRRVVAYHEREAHDGATRHATARHATAELPNMGGALPNMGGEAGGSLSVGAGSMSRVDAVSMSRVDAGSMSRVGVLVIERSPPSCMHLTIYASPVYLPGGRARD